MKYLRLLTPVLLALGLLQPLSAAEPAKLSLLFLGDNAGHQPRTRFALLHPVLAKKGIELTYTDKVEDLTLDNLNKYDGLVIYANQGGKHEYVQAILDYTASGKGFIPLHCASYCFTNDPDYINLVGAQFRSHEVGVFRVTTTEPNHPIMKGFQSFECWDETYVHTKHNTKDRTVLEVRGDGDLKEPWTWTRTHGKGRVFYTAWGHDARTWSHGGFHNLVERGIRWACGKDPADSGPYVDQPKMTPITGPKTDFEYVEAKLPFYAPGKDAGIIAEPITKMQKPLPVEKSMKHYTMPQDFELKLFATDEDFLGGKPLAMTWDEQGRLWVSVTTDYPNELKREGEGRDRILILEDTKGTGRADKVTVFADKLSIPTSLLCVHGGVVVQQAPHTLFLKDTDGDGKADVRQILFSGWGTGDTHAGPSNLRYGFDNWIYGAVGYSSFNGVVAGETIRFGSGYYRFKLEPGDPMKVTKLEYLRSTSNNTWGFCFNEDGEMFGSTANGCALVYLPIANRYYEKIKGLTPGGPLPPITLNNRMHPVTERVRQVDYHGGFTAASHAAIYTARTYPPEYWNKTAFVSEPTGHLTATFCLQSSGTDYIAHYGWNLLAADDEWAAPIDAQVGPDGHVWVMDWYNYIVQHNPTPRGFTTGKGGAYETDLRDKKHGRIYRLVYTKAPEQKIPNLKDASPEVLTETLSHPNMYWRLTAQRLLVEQGKTEATQAKSPLARLRATKPTVEIAEKLISDPSVAANADPKFQMTLYLYLADVSRSEKVGAFLISKMGSALSAQDRFLRDAWTIAASVHSMTILPLLLEMPAEKIAGNDSLRIVTENYVTRASTEDLEKLLTQLGSSKNGPLVESVITGLTTWPANRKPTLSNDGEKKLIGLMSSAPSASRGKLLKLASTWGVKGLDAQLAEVTKGLLLVVADAKATDAARLDAARQVLEFRGDDDASAIAVFDAVAKDSSATLAIGVLESLATTKARGVASTIVGKLNSLQPAVRPVALRLVLARPESTKTFLDAVEKGELRFDMLALDQKQALAAYPDKVISERAKKLLALGGGLPDANRQKVIDELSYLVKKTGDVPNGKKVFTTHCAKCHKYGEEGMQIGPELTGFAVHPKDEILIHVLDPSRSVEGNYKSYTAKLQDGRVIQGLLSSQSKTSYEILDAENKRHTIAAEDLDEPIKESTKSLMPEGFEKQMKAEELGDLLEFLTQKGKYVPIPLDKYATVVTTKGMFFDEKGEGERLILPDWKAKTVQGIPFTLTDPNGDKIKNAIMLYGPNGNKPPTMPKSVLLACNTPAKSIHFLSGIGGWNFPYSQEKTVSMIVRLHYADGKTEDHELRNGVHFADYISRTDVPGSKFALRARGQQIRYLSVEPKRKEAIKQIELVKGPDQSAPVVMAITVETPQ